MLSLIEEILFLDYVAVLLVGFITIISITFCAYLNHLDQSPTKKFTSRVLEQFKSEIVRLDSKPNFLSRGSKSKKKTSSRLNSETSFYQNSLLCLVRF